MNISIFLMLVFVAIIVWAFSREKKKDKWPPIPQPCPDYWTNTGDECINKSANGKCSAPINFTNVSLCDKYTWANNEPVANLPGCGNVLWDGVSYGYGQNSPCKV